MCKRKDPPFTKGWDVVQLETRVAGEWVHKDCFEPAEWLVCFWPDGKYSEFTNNRKKREIKSIWSFDADTEIISIEHESEFVEKCIFCDTDDVSYLYFYHNRPHIAPDRDTILEHHVHERWRIVRPWSHL